MPRFRSGVLLGGGGQGELANTQRAREEERECNRDGENGREKEEEMQSLSGMQLGARHRPGKDSSLSVFLLESSFSFFPQALRLSLSLLYLFRSVRLRTLIFSLAQFPIIHVSAASHAHTNTTRARTANNDYRK